MNSTDLIAQICKYIDRGYQIPYSMLDFKNMEIEELQYLLARLRQEEDINIEKRFWMNFRQMVDLFPDNFKEEYKSRRKID